LSVKFHGSTVHISNQKSVQGKVLCGYWPGPSTCSSDTLSQWADTQIAKILFSGVEPSKQWCSYTQISTDICHGKSIWQLWRSHRLIAHKIDLLGIWGCFECTEEKQWVTTCKPDVLFQ